MESAPRVEVHHRPTSSSEVTLKPEVTIPAGLSPQEEMLAEIYKENHKKLRRLAKEAGVNEGLMRALPPTSLEDFLAKISSGKYKSYDAGALKRAVTEVGDHPSSEFATSIIPANIGEHPPSSSEVNISAEPSLSREVTIPAGLTLEQEMLAEIYQENHKNLRRLAREAGVSESLMRALPPTSLQDFIAKISSGAYMSYDDGGRHARVHM